MFILSAIELLLYLSNFLHSFKKFIFTICPWTDSSCTTVCSVIYGVDWGRRSYGFCDHSLAKVCLVVNRIFFFILMMNITGRCTPHFGLYLFRRRGIPRFQNQIEWRRWNVAVTQCCWHYWSCSFKPLDQLHASLVERNSSVKWVKWKCTGELLVNCRETFLATWLSHNFTDIFLFGNSALAERLVWQYDSAVTTVWQVRWIQLWFAMFVILSCNIYEHVVVTCNT